MSVKRKWLAVAVCLALLPAQLSFNCEARGQAVEAHFKAVDSPRVLTDDDARTRAVLEQFAWQPAEFDVRCTATPGLAYDALVRFASPWSSRRRS